MGQSVYSPVCGSVYEDAPLNYLIDYADVNGLNGVHQDAQRIGLDAAGAKIFYFQYPTLYCFVAFNAVPLHPRVLIFSGGASPWHSICLPVD